jgi:phosphate transport system permease protein
MNSHVKNRIIDHIFRYLGILATLFGVVMLAIFLINIIIDGITRIDLSFLTNLPSRFPEKSGILTAWTGTLWILFLTAIVAIPIGMAARIYLEEYGKKNRIFNFLEINIANLAGVPSIIYGILGLQIFVRMLKLGGSLLTEEEQV